MAGKGNHGNSAEKIEAKFQKEKAEMKERMTKRNNEARKAKQQKSITDGQFVSTKPKAERLDISLQQILDRLIKESSRGFIEDVDWRDKESVQRRKAALGNVKDLLAIVKQMRELIKEVQFDEDDNTTTDEMNKATVTLLDDARKNLKDLGIDLED